ncbi:uncharacterized protein [Argopecten irradians]|uniref:uncharacterized protein n=1 Tax=Argopecten irradians TaxID=31199 RepID=UPI00371C0132
MTERCPPGWVQYGYSCYLVDLSSESVEWDDQMAACQQHNAFPLYVTGRQEGHFIDRLLTFHANTTFWTGMTNREGHFRFAHSYALAQHFRWDGREPDDKGCVNLVRTVNGLDLGIFYNNITSCNTTLPYICKMGSSIVGGVCEAHAACRGFATCNNYYGLCLCYAKSHRQMVGAPGNNMTYCSPRWKGNKDYLVLETGISVPWSVAVSLCKEHGGSLYSPVTEDLQQMGLHYIWEVGKGKSSWSSMHVDTGQEGKIFTTGFVPYDFVDYEYLPWRGPPAFTNFANASKINCIAVEISELGARLYALSCDTNMLATCFKYNDTTFSPFTITDNRGLTPVMTVEKIKSEDRCGLECLSRSWCLSFTLHNSTELCHLYDSKNTAVTPDTSLELHRKIAGQFDNSLFESGLFDNSLFESGQCNNSLFESEQFVNSLSESG